MILKELECVAGERDVWNSILVEENGWNTDTAFT